MKNRLYVALTAVAAMAVSATSAMATSLVDYSAAGTSLTAELTPALSAAIPLGATILAATIGWKLFKRFTK